MKAANDSRIKYTSWKREHQFILEQFKDKQIILLFSGGKDSSLALELIVKASLEFGFSFDAHGGAFPVHRYTAEKKRDIGSYWSERGVQITWHAPDETDQVLLDEKDPCLLCQKIRKNLLGTFLPGIVNNWNRLILIACYSLWDIVSYSMERLLSDLLRVPRNGKENILSNRFIETGQRFYPILKMKEGYSVFRPLIKYNGSDIDSYTQSMNMPTISIPCIFSNLRPKRILESYYEKMGLRFNYDNTLSFARSALGLPDHTLYESMGMEKYLREVF